MPALLGLAVVRIRGGYHTPKISRGLGTESLLLGGCGLSLVAAAEAGMGQAAEGMC